MTMRLVGTVHVFRDDLHLLLDALGPQLRIFEVLRQLGFLRALRPLDLLLSQPFGFSKICSLEVCSSEVGSLEICFSEVCFLEVGSSKVCFLKVYFSEVCSLEVSYSKVGFSEVSYSEVCSLEASSSEVCS